MGCTAMARAPMVGFAALLVGTMSCASASARDGIAVYVDGGLGGGRTEPHIVGAAVTATVGLGAVARLRGPTAASFQFRATVGGGFPGGMAPEAAEAGRQSLTTFLVGLEYVPWRSMKGPFLATGIGFGHSTISGARGPTGSPNYGFVPLRDRTGIAFGFGAGVRSSGGPGPLGMQLALWTHGLLRDGPIATAYATNLALGLVY